MTHTKIMRIFILVQKFILFIFESLSLRDEIESHQKIKKKKKKFVVIIPTTKMIKLDIYGFNLTKRVQW